MIMILKMIFCKLDLDRFVEWSINGFCCHNHGVQANLLLHAFLFNDAKEHHGPICLTSGTYMKISESMEHQRGNGGSWLQVYKSSL